MSAVQAVATPIYGQAIRLYGSIVTTTTGNPITGGLTALTGSVSIDGAAFASTGITVAEIGTTGYFYIEADATRMTGNSIIFKVTATNVNAREWAQFVYPAVLTESAGQWQDATVKRLEQGTVNMSAFLLNYQTLASNLQTCYARDSVTALFTGSLSGVASASSTQSRAKLV
jgi:hypothetical protein